VIGGKMKNENKLHIKTLALVIVILVVVIFGYFKITEITVEDVQKKIGKNISLGDSREQVIRFLDSEGIDHNGDREYTIKEKWIGAILRNTRKAMLVDVDIRVKFNFNKNNELENYEVEEVYTGM